MSQIPQPVATMVAGIVGLGVVAWQARLGFSNLVRSQENRAALDRDARTHQAELTREQKAAEAAVPRRRG